MGRCVAVATRGAARKRFDSLGFRCAVHTAAVSARPCARHRCVHIPELHEHVRSALLRPPERDARPRLTHPPAEVPRWVDLLNARRCLVAAARMAALHEVHPHWFILHGSFVVRDRGTSLNRVDPPATGNDPLACSAAHLF